MLRTFILLVLTFCNLTGYSQITGKITNTSGEALPYVNIYEQGSFSGTTSNSIGNYALEVSNSDSLEIVFQYLGYKTVIREISPSAYPFVLDVTLIEETTTLDEVIVDAGENPANKIMRQAIAHRQFHKEKITQYTADFYSRGIWRIENAPERILGMEVGDLGGGLDSTRSGILYLSETISKIKYRAPDDFREKIIASKVSGQDNGFSLNSAQEATISFYSNEVDLNSEIVSPLADYAFNYYRFELEGVFYNDRGNLVNKIEVIPKRPKDETFTGFVYIEEDSWQIFGISLKTTGEAMQAPVVEEVVFNQNFNYSEEEGLWVPISQTVDFSFGMFGISGNGRFTAVYTNYDFNPDFGRGTFTNEILSFEPAANEKDSVFWKTIRPVPLTLEEKNDYLLKDSIQEYRNSKPYLDSIDQVSNKFRMSNLLTGYTYRNSHEKWALSFSSPLFNTNVNSVQGYHSSLDVSFRKRTGERHQNYWRIFSTINYGFSEERWRAAGGFEKKFNNFSKPVLRISGGVKAKQFNLQEPITETINAIATNFFERNYLKLYELSYFQTIYEQDVFNGFRFFSSFSALKRSPLLNNWNSPWINRDDVEFSSNNPLEPNNYVSAPFEEHRIFMVQLAGTINFDQEYLMYPNGKYSVSNERYPRLSFSFKKGFGSDIGTYNYYHLQLSAEQNLDLGNKGEFGYNLKAGTFFNDKFVSFLDYHHFNGNQTRIGMSSSYLNRFNLLPYYALSTSDNYAEAHFEHNFEGWVLGKIPFINQLNYNLVLGAHQLIRQDRSLYSEISIGLDNLGFGKFRFLRLDYVISNYQGKQEGNFIFGLKFLSAL